MDTDLVKITNLLRKYEVNIINGSSKLCLTASLLYKINFALQKAEYNKTVTNSNSTLTDNVKFLCDIVRRVPKLVITQRISYETYRLDISKFGNLKYLELNNIPVHLVDGIELFRHQLQVLVCNNASATMKDIFGNSGVWDKLHTAKLCCNNFELLNESYNISWIQHLDLSNNRLKGDIKVQSLRTLKYLNLSFNCLTSLPVLHKDSYYSLKIIRLDNNFIENIMSVYLFSGLEKLYLSYNLIADHSALSSLGFLLNLLNVNLSNNPISYHPHYRVYFCHYINGSLNFNDFRLDGKLLNAIEKREVARLNCFMHDIVLPKHITNSPSSILKKSGLKSIPKKKARDAVIGNCFVNIKQSNCSTSTDRNTNLQSKCDIEEIREFRFRKRFSENPWSRNLSHRTAHVECGTGFNFESIASTTNSPPILESLQIVTNQLDSLDNKTVEGRNEGKFTGIIFNDEVKMLYFENFDKLYTQLLGFGINPEHLNSPIEIKMKGNDTYDVNEMETLTTDKLNENMTIKDDESTSSEESFDELMLAQKKLKDGNCLDVFITLNDSNIKEKSTITGRTLISWSLRSVESCEKLMTNPSTIRLVFNKIRKDFHERIYVMETTDADKLLKRMRLFLEARSMRSMNQTAYRCLKCNTIFSQEFQRSILFSLAASDNEICTQEPKVKCLICGSALVVIEEDVSLSKHMAGKLSSLPLSKSPSTIPMSVIESAAEEYKQAGELTSSSPVSDSDIEVITNPSQSSIEVLGVHDQYKVFPVYLSTTDKLKSCVRQNTDSDAESNMPGNALLRNSTSLESLSTNKHTMSNGKHKSDKEEVEKIPTPNTYTSLLEVLINCATAKFIPANRLR